MQIHAVGDFGAYKSGVFYNDKCDNTGGSCNHAVTLVGYGNENGEDYWLIRNSWGPNWGAVRNFKNAFS